MGRKHENWCLRVLTTIPEKILHDTEMTRKIYKNTSAMRI